MAGSGGGAPKLATIGFAGSGFAIVIFILGADAARSFAASVLLRVEDLEADAALDAVVEVFARPRRATGCSGGGGGRWCSGDVMETAKLSSLAGSLTATTGATETEPAKPGGAASEAMTCWGALGVLIWG